MPAPIEGRRLHDAGQHDPALEGGVVRPADDVGRNQQAAREGAVHEDQIARRGFVDRSKRLPPLPPFAERVHRARQLRKLTGLGSEELGERLARRRRNGRLRNRSNVERRRFHEIGDAAPEPDPRRAERGDLERAGVRNRARPAVDRPNGAGIDRLDVFEWEIVGVSRHHEVLVQLELSVDHADVAAGIPQEVGHECRGVVEPAGLDSIRADELFLRAAGVDHRHEAKDTHGPRHDRGGSAKEAAASRHHGRASRRRACGTLC